jgi:hypothetical protein
MTLVLTTLARMSRRVRPGWGGWETLMAADIFQRPCQSLRNEIQLGRSKLHEMFMNDAVPNAGCFGIAAGPHARPVKFLPDPRRDIPLLVALSDEINGTAEQWLAGRLEFIRLYNHTETLKDNKWARLSYRASLTLLVWETFKFMNAEKSRTRSYS